MDFINPPTEEKVVAQSSTGSVPNEQELPRKNIFRSLLESHLKDPILNPMEQEPPSKKRSRPSSLTVKDCKDLIHACITTCSTKFNYLDHIYIFIGYLQFVVDVDDIFSGRRGDGNTLSKLGLIDFHDASRPT